MMTNEQRIQAINLLPKKENWYFKEDGSIVETSRIMHMVGGMSYCIYNIFAFGVSDTTIYVLSDNGLCANVSFEINKDNVSQFVDYNMFSKDKIVRIELPNCFPTRGPQRK